MFLKTVIPVLDMQISFKLMALDTITFSIIMEGATKFNKHRSELAPIESEEKSKSVIAFSKNAKLLNLSSGAKLLPCCVILTRRKLLFKSLRFLMKFMLEYKCTLVSPVCNIKVEFCKILDY